MNNDVEPDETTRTPVVTAESSAPVRASRPELAWENEGGHILRPPERDSSAEQIHRPPC
jgi:hypothetical protein